MHPCKDSFIRMINVDHTRTPNRWFTTTSHRSRTWTTIQEHNLSKTTGSIKGNTVWYVQYKMFHRIVTNGLSVYISEVGKNIREDILLHLEVSFMVPLHLLLAIHARNNLEWIQHNKSHTSFTTDVVGNISCFQALTNWGEKKTMYLQKVTAHGKNTVKQDVLLFLLTEMCTKLKKIMFILKLK